MADKTRPHFTAFIGPQRLASGPLAEVAIAVMQASRRPAAPPIIIFSDASGYPLDLDLRGTRTRHHCPLAATRPAAGCRNRRDGISGAAWARKAQARRCRARGDVVAASLGVARRAARRRIGGVAQAGGRSAPCQWRCGSRPRGKGCRLSVHVRDGRQSRGFEEASRALFADDRRRFVGLVAGWPDDIRDHVVKLAFSDRAEP
jgi:Uncharacterized protein conserved in bacteria